MALVFLVVLCVQSTAQEKPSFHYQRPVPESPAGWYTIPLFSDVLARCNATFSDLRIWHVTKDGDTIEAPYLLKQTAEEKTQVIIPFEVINSVTDQKGSYFTLALPEKTLYDQLELQFSNPEFDWKIRLDGSHEERTWYTIVDDYRILSILNNAVSFSYTTVHFSPVSFKYLRIWIKPGQNANLESATITKSERKAPRWNEYPSPLYTTRDSASLKASVIEADLGAALPVSHIALEISDTMDYYRPMRVDYATDSIDTPSGKALYYTTAWTGTLHSLQKSWQVVPLAKARNWRIFIYHQDNEALTVSNLRFRGPHYSLIVRLPEKASFDLYYGQPSCPLPNYDLVHFSERIPDSLTVLTLGPERRLKEENRMNTNEQTPMPELWLWIVVGTVMMVLVYFAWRMLRHPIP